MAPVGIAEPLISPPSLGVVEAHAQRDPLVPELAGGGLGRADQGGADPLSPEWPEDLQVAEPGHTGKLSADLGLFSRLALQDRHQRGKVSIGAWPDLYPCSHEVQPSDPAEPVYLIPVPMLGGGDQPAGSWQHHYRRPTVADMAGRPAPTRLVPERVVVIGCAGSGKTTLAQALAVRLGARHIERDALGDDESPGFATQVAAAVDAAGSRWVFDGAPYNAEMVVYPCADTVVALDYPRWVVQRRVLARSARLWLTRRADGAHTSTDPPWRWWTPHHPVGWAARTHAARHAEIAELFSRPELAHAHRLRFTSPRQAAVWLLSLSR